MDDEIYAIDCPTCGETIALPTNPATVTHNPDGTHTAIGQA